MAKSFGPAVIIGLGGTGQKALIRIKKLFLDHCGLIPPCIKLLAFDTTSNREATYGPAGDQITFSGAEFCHMSVKSVAQAIKNPFVQKWWIPYDAINSSSVNQGTGGIREVGRLATFANIDTVESLLRKAFEQVHAFGLADEMRKHGMEMLPTTAQVFVVGSLAGGTGSGSFVDFSVLSRALGGAGMSMFYTAYFVMPWVFRDVAKTCYENGYAALLELDKLNGASPDNPYTVEYTTNLKPELTERPYHIVNLIDGQCRNQQRLLLRNEVPEFVGEAIFNSVGGVATKYRDIVDNIMTMITLAHSQSDRWGGQQAIYSTTGVSAIVYPGAKIHERLKAAYACRLIDHAIAFVGGKRTAGKVDAEVQAFLSSQRLTTDSSGLLQKILPAPQPAYVFDDKRLGLNLRDPNVKIKVPQTLQNWSQAQKRNWKIDEQPEAVRGEVSRAVTEFLATIRAREAAKEAELPDGSYIEANRVLLRYWKEARDYFTQEQAKLRDEGDKLRADAEAAEKAIEGRIATSMWASTNPARNACRQYCDCVSKLLQHELKMNRVNKAATLCGSWYNEAMAREQQYTGAVKPAVVVDELKQLQNRLASQITRLSAANILKQKAKFEIYVGVEEVRDGLAGGLKDCFYVCEGSRSADQVPAEDFSEFCTHYGINQPSEFNSLPPAGREKMLLEFSAEKMRPATAASVFRVLKTLQAKDPQVIERLTDQAIRYSSQLLPINENALTGQGDLLTEFSVIGGVFDDEAVESAMREALPQSRLETIQNVWADTGEPSRLTFANYLSVIPLHVLNGIEQVRERYLMRVRPPAHTDRLFEFPLTDLLPATSCQIDVLKMLSLALLDSIAVVERVKLEKPVGDSHYYYRMNPKFFPVVDEKDLVLPGTPGKFYSLYEQLCRDNQADLRRDLRNALIDLADSPAFSAATLHDEIQRAYRESRETLEGKEFNKMITGMLYRQQMAYFRGLLQMEWTTFSMQKALDLPVRFSASK